LYDRCLGYELIKLEKKTGSPEKPLSTLGQMTYKSYWHSTILTKLEEYRSSRMHVTITKLSIDTGISIEDVVQTLIDLRVAHTGTSTIETNYKQQEARDRRQRRRQILKNDYDNNTTVLAIDEDLLHSTMARLLNGNLLSKQNQHIFDPTYLRLSSRR
jgi:hypothetical protein